VVARLGIQTPPAELQTQRYRILQGQQLHLQYASDNAASVRAWARIIYDNGVDSILYVPDQTLAADRVPAVLTASEVATQDGWITTAVVEMLSDGVKRGQTYVKLLLAPESRIFGTVLCADYCYSTFGEVVLGTYIQPGPGGGGGNLQVVTVVADVTPVTVTHTLAASNTIRKIYNLTWYYECSSDIATRDLLAFYRNTLGALPTGFSAAGKSDVWTSGSSGLLLTQDQEGTVFADPKRYGTNDNSSIAINSDPSPFPLLITEDDLAVLVFFPSLAETDDRQSIYLLREEWVVL